MEADNLRQQVSQQQKMTDISNQRADDYSV